MPLFGRMNDDGAQRLSLDIVSHKKTVASDYSSICGKKK